MIGKVQETHLYKWLYEKNSEFLGQVNEAILYAETMLPLISKVFTDYTVHGIKHSINVMEYMFSLITDIEEEYYKQKTCYLATISAKIEEIIFDGVDPNISCQEKTQKIVEIKEIYDWKEILEH